MLKNKKIIFISVGLLILMALSLIIFKPPADKTLPSSSPIIMASPSSKPQTPYISYDEGRRNQLVNIMKNRPKISDKDQILRNKVISQLGNKSGVIISTDSYIIKYVKTPNIFQVEILTNDYLTVKQQAAKWFEDQGFSDDGICKLPIQFFLSAEVKDNLQDSVENFNYLPEGC